MKQKTNEKISTSVRKILTEYENDLIFGVDETEGYAIHIEGHIENFYVQWLPIGHREGQRCCSKGAEKLLVMELSLEHCSQGLIYARLRA